MGKEKKKQRDLKFQMQYLDILEAKKQVLSARRDVMDAQTEIIAREESVAQNSAVAVEVATTATEASASAHNSAEMANNAEKNIRKMFTSAVKAIGEMKAEARHSIQVPGRRLLAKDPYADDNDSCSIVDHVNREGILMPNKISAARKEPLQEAKIVSKGGVVSNLNGWSIGREQIERLSNGLWLDDSMVNCYLRLLQTKENSSLSGIVQDKPRIFFYNSLVFESIYRQVETLDENAIKDNIHIRAVFNKNIDVFTYNLWVVPMYSKSTKHWALGIVDLVNDRLEIWDSMPGVFKKRDAVVSLKALLFNQWQLRNQTTDLPEAWRQIKKLKLKVPAQSNGSDCGVFMLHFADLQAHRKRIMSKEDLQQLSGRSTSQQIQQTKRTSIAASVSGLIVF